MTEQKNTALVKASEFAVFNPEQQERMKRVMRLNFGDQGIKSPFNLKKIKMPTGGGLAFNVDTLTGRDSVELLDVIVVHWQATRGYWPGEFAGSQPPECSSENGIFGNRYGPCEQCKHSKFGSNGERPACKEMRRLLLLLPGNSMPFLFSVPPSSIKAWDGYRSLLGGAGYAFLDIVTQISLQPAQSRGGIDYAKADFHMGALLTREQTEIVEHIHDTLAPQVAAMAMGAEDYENGGIRHPDAEGE